ncbi:ATP-binding protein, partial [Streptomyces lydicus]|uniref:ATP-binding protein n=1 Tax=Streptomyces lydicus TaxID=47763 RepID=UPI003675A92F
AWSWDLLSEPEQRAARRFTVFAGGATARSALRVCGTDGETLEALADKSLLEVAGGRYRMLETIRAYGAERLDAAGERESVRRAHAQRLLELLRTADPHLRRAEQLEWLPVVAAEHGDLLAALRWAVEGPAVETAFELLAAAFNYLWIRGASASVAPLAIALLASVGEAAPDGLGEEYATCVLLAGVASATGEAGGQVWQRHRATAGKALAAAWPGDRSGRYPVVLLLWMMRNAGGPDPQSAFALVSSQRDCPEPWARAAAHYVSGFGHLGRRDPAAAEDAFGQALEEFRSLGDRWGIALALDTLAGVAGARGDRTRALALTDEALVLTERLGALEDSADLLVNRGDHLAGDDPAGARDAYANAAALARRAGSSTYLAAALRGLGDIALEEGDLAAAERLYSEALERNDPHWIKSLGPRVRTLIGLGRVAAARSHHTEAREYYRQAVEVADTVGAHAPEVLRMLGLSEKAVESVLEAVVADR